MGGFGRRVHFMPDKISKTQRWLDLIAYLVGRKLPVSVEELMERVPAYSAKWSTGDDTARASVRRTFERDKDELRDYGIPIETVEYSISWGTEETQGYRLRKRDFYLPYLRMVAELRGTGGLPASAGTDSQMRGIQTLELAADDASAALSALHRVADVPDFPLASEARSAFRKMAFDLDVDRLTGKRVLYADRPEAEDLQEALRRLSDALLGRKRVRFTYHGIYRHRATERDVEPFGLFFQGGHWYLVGNDKLRSDLRVFRVGRIDNLTPNPRAPHTPDYDIPDDFRIDDHLGKDAWELGGDDAGIEAYVRFAFPTSLWAARNGYGRLVEESGDGAAIRLFTVHQVSPFLRWLMSLEGEAELMAPPELRAELRSLAVAVTDVYGKAAEPDRACDDPDSHPGDSGA
jgi:proteasome accessory factor B